MNATASSATVVGIPPELAVTPSTLTRNAISIRTVDPNQSISVYAQNSNQNSSDVFLALPVREYNDVLRYQYTHMTSQPKQNDYSIFVLANCNDDVIVPFLQSPSSLSGLIPVRDVYRLFADSREFIEDHPTPLRRNEKLETFHFENNASVDITGIKAWASRPFTFISGLACTSESCDHVSQQIPPSYTWGYAFSTFPVAAVNVPSYQIKVVSVYDGTVFTYHCNNGTNGSSVLFDEGYTLEFLSQTVCSLTSDRPVAVVEILQQGISSGGAMVWLAPMSQYLSSITFPTDLSNRESPSTNQQEFVWLVVPANHFNTSLIRLDGLEFQPNEQSLHEIMCSSTEVCAYGVAVQVSSGVHTFHHDGCQGCLSVIIFGNVGGSIYAYSAGFAMDPIGGISMYKLCVTCLK